MTGQFSLFDSMFSEAFGEDAPIMNVEEEKKEEKKAKKAASKKGTETKVNLPVTVIASSWSEEVSDIDGKTEVTLEELKTHLIEEGYVELKMHGTGLFVEEDSKVVVGFDSIVSSNATRVFFTSEELVICQGQFTMSLDKDDFNQKSLADCAKAWEEQYPSFVDTKFYYDIATGVLYPVAGDEIKDDTEIEAGTVKYVANGAIQEITLEEKITADGLGKKIVGVSGCKFYKSEDVYFPIIVRKVKKGSGGSSSSVTPKTATKVEEQKFQLPFTVTFSHADDMNITAATFPGKTEVTSKELQQYLMGIYEEYTEDKTEFIYFKKDSVVEARIKSAKRG